MGRYDLLTECLEVMTTTGWRSVMTIRAIELQIWQPWLAVEDGLCYQIALLNEPLAPHVDGSGFLKHGSELLKPIWNLVLVGFINHKACLCNSVPTITIAICSRYYVNEISPDLSNLCNYIYIYLFKLFVTLKMWICVYTA